MRCIVDINLLTESDGSSGFSNLKLLVSFPVATPKQIRELMQVDGLTNDEVKSHLQASSKSYF